MYAVPRDAGGRNGYGDLRQDLVLNMTSYLSSEAAMIRSTKKFLSCMFYVSEVQQQLAKLASRRLKPSDLLSFPRPFSFKLLNMCLAIRRMLCDTYHWMIQVDTATINETDMLLKGFPCRRFEGYYYVKQAHCTDGLLLPFNSIVL
jgi:hypothetical protein